MLEGSLWHRPSEGRLKLVFKQYLNSIKKECYDNYMGKFVDIGNKDELKPQGSYHYKPTTVNSIDSNKRFHKVEFNPCCYLQN